MLALPPTRLFDLCRQFTAQGNDLPHTVLYQAALRGVVNIGFDDKRIAAHALRCFTMKFLTVAHDGMAYRCNGCRLKLAESIANTSCTEVRGNLRPLTDTQYGLQCVMVLSLILQLVIIKVAAE